MQSNVRTFYSFLVVRKSVGRCGAKDVVLFGK